MRPTVSVIMPAWNAESFVVSAVRSVQAQTRPDWELIVVDDASTDSTVRLLSRFASEDSRIRVYTLSCNSGAAAARNEALRYATGRFVAFLDSDDLWVPKKLALQLSYMISHGAAFTYGAYGRVAPDDTPVGTPVWPPASVGYRALLTGNPIGCLTVMIDRDAVGDFVFPSFRVHQDWALWLQLAKRGYRPESVGRILGHYRLRPGSVSRNRLRTIAAKWHVYRDGENLNVTTAVVCLTLLMIRGLAKEVRSRI